MMHADCSFFDVEEYPFAICTAALVALIDDTVAITRAGMRAFHTFTHEAKVGDFGDAAAVPRKTVQTTTKKATSAVDIHAGHYKAEAHEHQPRPRVVSRRRATTTGGSLRRLLSQ